MIKHIASFATRFASLKSRSHQRHRSDSHQYATLERKQVLTSVVLPPITTDIAAFSDATDAAFVGINDNSELVVQLTGQQDNNVEINLEWGLILVNSTDQELALGIDTDRYNRILVIGGGEDDRLLVIGNDLRAQLFPTRTWIHDADYARADDQDITVQGLNLENVEIENFQIPFVTDAVGNNTVRFFGTDGDDHLTMTGSQSATFVGDNYEYRASGVDELYAFAEGGVNFASVIGTREIDGPDGSGSEIGDSDWHCADDADDAARTCFPYTVGDGVDQFYANDDFAQLRNDQLLARFHDFGTTRVDLLSGEDEVHVQDSDTSTSRYRVDGETLVGSNRRFINAEKITIDGADVATNRLVTPDLSAGTLTTDDDDYQFRFQRDTSVALSDEDKLYEELNQVIPDEFVWNFTSFEETI